MIYITGDTHGGFQRFATDYFPQQKQMSRDDYAIITGDFGGVWDDSPREAYWLDWLEEKPFTTLFVDGNHENFDRLGELPVHQWQGGKVRYIRPHVLHLMRGQIFEINGTSFSPWATLPPTTSRTASSIRRPPTLSWSTGSSAGHGRYSG